MLYKHVKSRMLQMLPRVHARMFSCKVIKPFAVDEQRDAHVKIVEDLNAVHCKVVFLVNCDVC